MHSFGEGISGGAQKAALVVKEISIAEEECPVWHRDSKGALEAKPHPTEPALAKIQIH